MALWQIIDRKNNSLDEQFDDGRTASPGEPDFSTAEVEAYAGKANYNYLGTPNWKPVEPAPTQE